MIKKCGKSLRLTVIYLILVFILVQSTYFIFKNGLTNDKEYCSFYQSSSPIIVRKNLTSLCSIRATQRGFNQKIISISFFGPVENPKMFSLNKSLIFLQEFIYEIEKVYADGWILRVYHDEKILNQTIISHFEQRYTFIDFCNVKDINLDFIPPRIWRFLPAGDEMVGVMISRDLDSPLTPRERAAVDEWLTSNFSFHAMRDHPFHATSMMAGMWGFRPARDRNYSHVIRSKLFDRSLIIGYSLNTDQEFLNTHLWPSAQHNAMTHDSYLCTSKQWNRYHRPFPTQRPMDNLTNYCFIGCPKPCCINQNFHLDRCPSACRPKEHQDWIYC